MRSIWALSIVLTASCLSGVAKSQLPPAASACLTVSQKDIQSGFERRVVAQEFLSEGSSVTCSFFLGDLGQTGTHANLSIWLELAHYPTGATALTMHRLKSKTAGGIPVSGLGEEATYHFSEETKDGDTYKNLTIMSVQSSKAISLTVSSFDNIDIKGQGHPVARAIDGRLQEQALAFVREFWQRDNTNLARPRAPAPPAQDRTSNAGKGFDFERCSRQCQEMSDRCASEPSNLSLCGPSLQGCMDGCVRVRECEHFVSISRPELCRKY